MKIGGGKSSKLIRHMVACNMIQLVSYVHRHFTCRNNWTYSGYSKYEYVNEVSANDTLTDIKTQVCFSSKKRITVNNIYAEHFFYLGMNMVMMFWKIRVLWVSWRFFFCFQISFSHLQKAKKESVTSKECAATATTKTNKQTKKRLLCDLIKMLCSDSGIASAHSFHQIQYLVLILFRLCQWQGQRVVEIYFRLPSTFYMHVLKQTFLLEWTMKTIHDMYKWWFSASYADKY